MLHGNQLVLMMNMQNTHTVMNLKLSLSVLTAIFQENLGQPVFIEAKDDGGSGDNRSYKSCKAPNQIITSNKPTSSFFTGWMPFLSPNQQRQSTEGKISRSMNLLTPSSPGVFQLSHWATNSSWLPWGRVAMRLISPLMPAPQMNLKLNKLN